MESVLMEPEAVRADVTDAADVAIAEAAQMFAAHATDMGPAAKASHVPATAKAAAHMAAATEASAAKTSAMTATATAAAGLSRTGHQARSKQSCRQYRDHPFHRDTPFQSDCSAPQRANSSEPRGRNVG
ncbi:hypothetical protein CQ14_00565 [Bradyrhizobium lablabi]|uniref:Uncharacterized protein n=1 Tax=Bradyrhizobium lablabi TaxID=722472 RepID=A0A0R3MSZ3_9BRAD|nr:hypothetical protein CQ14_00565 [Bradyrhizobium lablabi]